MVVYRLVCGILACRERNTGYGGGGHSESRENSIVQSTPLFERSDPPDNDDVLLTEWQPARHFCKSDGTLHCTTALYTILYCIVYSKVQCSMDSVDSARKWLAGE